MNRILRYALALAHTVIESVRIEGDAVIVGVRPWKRHGLRNIDNKQVDFDGWTLADCERAAQLALQDMEPASYIPCITQGIPGGVYPGTYMGLVNAIDKLNAERFGHSIEDLVAARDQLDVFEYALEDVMPKRAKHN